jgi:predicted amidohydrolase
MHSKGGKNLHYKIALAQINPALGDIKKNLLKHEEFTEKAIKEKADLIVFPELSLTGYKLGDLTMEVALPYESDFFKPLLTLGKHIDIVLGFVERGKDKNSYNSAMYISEGRVKSVYEKLYPATHGMFDELRFVARGKEIKIFDTKIGKVSMLICRDIFHPSLMFLAYASNADIVLVLSNMPLRGLKGEKPAIQETVEKAIDTYTNFFGMFVAYVNRVGFDDGLGFFGGSFVCTPSGRKLAYAGLFDEVLTFAEIDSEEIFKKRQTFPLLREEDMNIVKLNFDKILEDSYD